jgi:hypothetical protein
MQKQSAALGSPDDEVGAPTIIGLLKKMANWKAEAKAEAEAAAKPTGKYVPASTASTAKKK